jgi:uncharacterized protein
MTVTLRRLAPGEDAAIEAFLAATPETTLFLRSNLARAGLVDDGRPFSGTWVGAFDGERLVGVASHFWNDNILFAPGPHAEAASRHAVELSGRIVGGLLGPHAELVRTREALGLRDASTSMASKEILYTLPLSALVVPPAIADGSVVVRAPLAAEMEAILDWRMQYVRETMDQPDTPKARADQAVHLAAYQEKGHHFVVTVAGERVSYSAFNATVADLVQIGGVWTPPALRSHGYARCAVAGSLQHARDRGVSRAILFTDDENVAAQHAYAAIGFRPIGDYGIVFFA